MLFFTLKRYILAVSLYTTQCKLEMKSSRNIYSIEIYEKWLVQAYTCALSTSGTCSVPLVGGLPRLIPIRRRYTSLLVEPLIAFLYTALSLPLFSHVLSWISDKVALLSMPDPILFSWPILCREGQLLCEETAVTRGSWMCRSVWTCVQHYSWLASQGSWMGWQWGVLLEVQGE